MVAAFWIGAVCWLVPLCLIAAGIKYGWEPAKWSPLIYTLGVVGSGFILLWLLGGAHSP